MGQLEVDVRIAAVVGVALALVLIVPAGALAGESPGDESKQALDAPPMPEGAKLAVVRATSVNVRVGPRRDNNPITQLDEGAVVIIVERVGDWAGVRIPAGMPAVVSGKYTERVGEDGVRIKASRLNLRVTPPEKDRPLPGAFRDKVSGGDLLPWVRTEDGWHWVMVPEGVRAYVYAKYLEVLGPPAEHAAVLAKARAERAELLQSMADSRRRLKVMKASMGLRGAIADAQKSLHRLRLEGGHDRQPVAQGSDVLAAAVKTHELADAQAKKIAAALLEDFEAEIALRLARHDAEVAKLRGAESKPVAPITKTLDGVEVTGTIRWEAAPRWDGGGAFILWIDGEPSYVLRLTTGTPGPLPNLKGSCDGKPRTVKGRQPGERVFGLPAIDVLSLSR